MITLIALFLMFQQPAAKTSIEGVVTQADIAEARPLPIADARVELTGGPATRIVRTDREGRFRIADIDAGQYRVKVTADGFAAAEYGPPPPAFPGTPLTVTTGVTIPRVDFKLVRAATITGRVHDSDNEPLAGAIVQLFKGVAGPPGPTGPRTTPVTFTRTDDRGDYRLYWLTPDEYYVSVNYTSARLGPLFVPPNANMLPVPNGYPLVYYRAASDVARAEKIQLQAGEERSAVDFHLTRASAVNISGTVTDARTGRGAQVQIMLAGPSRVETQTDATGRYELRSIPSGPYRIIALSLTSENLVAERSVEVGDRDLSGIDIVLDPGRSVRGKIVSEDNSPVPNVDRITILLSRPDGPGSQARIDPSGDFEVRNVTNGSYTVVGLNLPADFYVKSATFGRADALNTPVAVSGETQDTFEIVLSSATGRIRGTAIASGGKPFPGAQILLAPEDRFRDRSSLFKTVTADQAGAFTLRGIPPGSYFLFAWNILEPGAYTKPEFLRRYDQSAVSIKIEATVESTVQVPVVVRD